ncbi:MULTISPECIES: 16S rRNA (cytosine(1402)-N(4))-methyltransferase RsmH [Halorhodospira]|uniref:16S rRNA (cytosine(1402)-N(4))-methyltransferase RsmH n=1 Tax=Halorhodospira TaxID=85108 RepID=UPI001EE7BF69|nr:MULTISPECIES: 16S rRNA (cytosine(1402)-N(4))-methyltransferase RsmH [Halorhodospira]MCG5527467.1 16S rRNA (cytosine(1402)-N(4))-methyltransferase RsmH [Halorhodospira halophila]MCG5544293.1 16S rRNA (cytosine(1402)-N(4))-methyltransferase RsmH [Halorhodospira sp. 9628]
MSAAEMRAVAEQKPTATTHRPVLYEAALEALAVRPDGCYVDATYGRGGHARGILERLGPRGQLWVADRDPEALAHARETLSDDPRCTVLGAELADLPRMLSGYGLTAGIDGLLADLGISSPQVDNPDRGFSFQRDGPLDMRMDPSSGESAAALLERLSVREIAGILRQLGEERHAGRIARAVVAAREAGEPPRTTLALARLVEQAVPRREPGRHPATRTFQALRIAVNDELGQLDRFLDGAIDLLAPGGRLAVIAFHSLEDRRVKRFIRRASSVGDLPPSVPVPPEGCQPRLRPLGRDLRAGDDEVAGNPRARSAVLRVAERLS